MNETQLTTTDPLIQTLADIEDLSVKLAPSGLLGKDTKASTVFGLMLLCHCEGLNPIAALRRYHIIEGRPSLRADAMLADFAKAGGGVLWHVRTDDMVAATWFSDAKKIDDKSRARAAKRFELLWRLPFEEAPGKKSVLLAELAGLAHDGEETVIRTFADACRTGLALSSKVDASGQPIVKDNWARNTRAMLTARNATEGIRIVLPGLIAGIAEESEVRDIVDMERSADPRPERGQKTDHDREAIQAMITQHIEDGMNAKGPVEKSHYLGLASDLKVKLAEMETATFFKKEEATAQRLSDEMVANAVNQAIHKVVDATDATVVDDADGVQRSKIRDAKPVADEGQIPGLEKPSARATCWQDHSITQSKGYKDRLLGDLTKDEVKVLHQWLQKKVKADPGCSPMMKMDAAQTALAWESWNEPGAEG